MAEATSLKEILVRLMDVRTATIVTGEVTKADPLEIQVDNDAMLVVTDSNTFVPEHLTNYDVSIEIPSIGTRKCEIKNALKKGDKVYMLAYERGALYFVIDRVGD